MFTGGTSLSRVHGLIERFSEDVDLLAVFPEGAVDGSSPTARHAVLKAVDAAVSAHIGVPGVAYDSTTGVKRYTRYEYEAENESGAIRPGVVLELGSRGGGTPADTHRFRSIVADHAIDVLGDSEAEWDEFRAFDLLVLAPERTLMEKLAAIHASAELGDGPARVNGARHNYDVFRLLQSSLVTDALDSLGARGIAQLADDIHDRSVAAGLPSVKRPAGGYAESAAFDKDQPTWPALSAAYSEVVSSLVYGTAPSLAAVLAAVESHRDQI